MSTKTGTDSASRSLNVPQPVVLREVSLDDARLGNQACRQLVGRHIALGDGTVTITGAWPHAQLPPDLDMRRYLFARLSLDRLETTVVLPLALLDAIGESEAVANGLLWLPPALQTAVLNVVLEPALGALEAGLGVTVAQLECEAIVDSPCPCVELGLSWSGRAGARFRAFIGVDPLYARAFQRPGGSSINVNPLVQELAVTGRIEYGGTWLDSEDLASLCPGDVVLLNDVCDTGGLWMELGGGTRLDVAIDSNNRLTIQEVTMSDDALNDGDIGEAVRGDDVLIRIAVEVGRMELKVRQLNALVPGYVLQLPSDWATTRVYLTAGGRRIGEGELVNVGDDLGLQIAEIYRGRLD